MYNKILKYPCVKMLWNSKVNPKPLLCQAKHPKNLPQLKAAGITPSGSQSCQGNLRVALGRL